MASDIEQHLQIEERDAYEAEAKMARTEKEKLFTLAQRHHRNGELGSALTQLEKLLALSGKVPSSCVPEREKVFASFYAALRSERDGIDQCCAEASLALADNNFEKALALYDSLQARYPNNQEFQALRLKAQQVQRQQLLAYVGEVARAVEAEPNLDGRVCLLQEAVKRYPNEELLARQFSLACEQRDLAASIVAKARAYELEGQLGDAIQQWKALQNINPLYPGLAAEIQQLEQRREQIAEQAQKSHLITEIKRAAGSHACSEADRLLEEARTVSLRGDPDRAMTLLRQALDLDPRQIVARNKLVHLLLERARTLLPTDPSAAEALAAEAAKLDPGHSSLQKIFDLVAKAKRKKPRKPALLEASSNPAPIEPVPAPQPIKLFLDDDFPESPRASQRPVSQAPQATHEPVIAGQFREIRSVLVYNVKDRLLDNDLVQLFLKLSEFSRRIPLTARQTRGILFAALGALVPILLLSSASRYVSRPPVAKPMTAPEVKIAPASPAPQVTIPIAPSSDSLATEAVPDASPTTPPAADQTVEHPVAAKKDTALSRRVDIPAKAPILPQFTISSGTAGATVIVDDLSIGQLDEKGNFAYAGITAGTHKIELRKAGLASRTFYGQTFQPGKPFDLPGDKHLPPVAGYALITVSPRNASVSYKVSGESEKHPVSDLNRALSLPPGDYEFSAEAPQFAPKLVDVKIQADQTTTISFDLKPSARTAIEQNTGFVNLGEAVKTHLP